MPICYLLTKQIRKEGRMEERAEFEGVEPRNIKRNMGIFVGICLLFGVFFKSIGLTDPQVLSSSIFMSAVLGTLMFWGFRVGIAFLGVALLLITKTIDVERTIEFASMDVIFFLIGMMIIVDMLRDVGILRWFMVKIVKATGFRTTRLVFMLSFSSMFLAMAIDEVTSIIFITSIVIELCDYFDINPTPLLIGCVFATNVGSSGTVLGNPIGILIAMKSGLSFEDFIRWAFPVALIGVIVTIVLILWWYRKYFADFTKKIEKKLAESKESKKIGFLCEWDAIKNRSDFSIGLMIFLGTIILVVLHRRIETAFGLQHNTMLIAASFTGAGFVMLWRRLKAKAHLERGVDWWTLTFFMLLFAKAGTLKFTGVTDVMAKAIVGISGDSMPLLITIVLWMSSLGSAFLDNVVMVAAMIPVIHNFADAGIPVKPLWWALLFGGCFGGNITMIGSTANIVALGVLEKRKGIVMVFFRWFWIGLIVGGITTVVAHIYLLLVYPFM